MADRNSRADEGVSESTKEFRNRRHPANRRKSSERSNERSTILMNRPKIEVTLAETIPWFKPGDVLVAEYKIDVPADQQVSAVESSVIWLTAGKGDEDYGVHFFERRPKSTLNRLQLSRPHRISTVLPLSPLSYEGDILQISWCVRVRLFVEDSQFSEDMSFRLGKTTTDEYQTISTKG